MFEYEKRYSSGGLLGSTCRKILFMIFLLVALLAIYVAARFCRDIPVDYTNPEEHFKYGSTGGERVSGFPYWIWQAIPHVFADKLPGPGYQSLGMIYEKDKDLPVGVSKRRVTGMDRVFLNCAACHTSTIRDTPQTFPRLVSGMPANTFDIKKFEEFFFSIAADRRFSPEWIVPQIQKMGGDLSLVDRYLVYPVAIHLMRDRLLMLRARFAFVEKQPEWGPGRVDTFNSAKAIFNFPMEQAPEHELHGAADFPSIWNQRARIGMQLHWDGNNTVVEERNKSAAFGTGTTPPTIDLERIKRTEDWLLDFKPPRYPYAINHDLTARGSMLYGQYCATCHGASGSDFSGKDVGKVVPLDQIGTDRGRLDSYTYELAVNQSTLYAGYPWRFSHFRKTFGYANMPLDGVWLRAPYLHNGSVPTLRDLLEPGVHRPKVFYRGYDVYDQINVGFMTNVAQENGKRYFKFDTAIPGNGNMGHEGPAYGTELSAADKDALVEFLKTF